MSVIPSDWYCESLTPDLALVSRLNKTVFSKETRYQRVDIIDTIPFGRCLVLDGKIQSSEADEFIYHESLVHPAMLCHRNPKNILVIGGGEGATVREVLMHNTVQHVTMVDIDSEVVKLCQTHLTAFHKDSFDDERLHCLLYTSPSPRDATLSRMPSSA